MEAVRRDPDLTVDRGAARHVLLILDGTEVDDLLITLGSYSAAVTGGRISLLLLPGHRLPVGLWLQVAAHGVAEAHAAGAYLSEVAERIEAAGAAVDRVQIGDVAEAASAIERVASGEVDIVAASSPTLDLAAERLLHLVPA